jgi:nucleotide-binding universal stress UspA family protein
MPVTFLVAYDFTELSERALEWAARLARGSGASLLLLHVYVLPLPAMPTDPVTVAVNAPTAEQLQALEARLQTAARDHGLDPRVEVALGVSAGAVIVERAEALGADLIALGTHGRRGLSRLVLGSVAEYVVRHARCPVLTVRGPDGARSERRPER